MWAFWKKFWLHVKAGYSSPLRYWIFLFAIFHLVAEHHGGTNPQSRLASLAAFAERGSFRLDPHYNQWTIDWARTPDGVYSSNKAPGPTYLALIPYLIFDSLTQIGTSTLKEERVRRHKTGHPFLRIASFLFQIIPWALLALVSISLLQAAALSQGLQQLFLLSILFGNTLSIFMGSYFGHGVAGVFLALMCLALYWKHLMWAGFFFGWALLSDYGVAATLLGILVYVLAFSPRIWRLYHFALGGIVPGILWIGHHTSFYGSPFSLSNKFQNPKFVDLAHDQEALWGVIRMVPSAEATFELIFGTQRGLLFTQPWILILLGMIIFSMFSKTLARTKKAALSSLIISFTGLFLMNASFGAWHAGASSGPRYLSFMLPLFALAIPIFFNNEKFNRPLGRVFVGAIIYSVAINAVFLSTSIIHGHMNLFESLLHFFTHPNRLATSLLRMGIFILGSIMVLRKIKSYPSLKN